MTSKERNQIKEIVSKIDGLTFYHDIDAVVFRRICRLALASEGLVEALESIESRRMSVYLTMDHMVRDQIVTASNALEKFSTETK